VNRRGVKIRYLAIAAAWRNGATEPAVLRGPEVAGHPNGASFLVEGEGFRDTVVWQPEDSPDAPGKMISAGDLKTDALMAMIRTDPSGKVLGYVMGDGQSLEYRGRALVLSPQRLSVTADAKRCMATGPRRARQGLAPLPVAGSFWLPDARSEIWADGARVKPRIGTGRMATLAKV
jgi:hypothetical protein